MDQFKIEWLDRGREPQCPPDPAYPNGKDVDGSVPGHPSCKTDLPYPAKRCGYYVVTCRVCDTQYIATTAGRPDDPRSITVVCMRPLMQAIHGTH